MMQPYGAGICRALVSTSLYAAPAAACKRLPDWDRVRPDGVLVAFDGTKS